MITIEVFQACDSIKTGKESKESSAANTENSCVGEVRLVGWSLDKQTEQTVLVKEDETSIDTNQELISIAKTIELEFLEYYENSTVIPLGGNLEQFYWMLKD